jgi:hypothetical protein
MADELVGSAEIARRLGLSHPESVHVWRNRYDDFPEPTRVGRTYVWSWPAVRRWAIKTKRLDPKTNKPKRRTDR